MIDMPSPALVLLPGMDGTGDLFAPLLEKIPTTIKVRVIRYPSDSAAGYRELTDYVRQQLPQDGDYVLLGESFSGPVAIALAAQALPGMRGLVLGCTFASNPQPCLRIYTMLMRMMPMSMATSALTMRVLLQRYATDAACAMLRRAIRSVPKATLLARMREIATVDMREQFACIKLPILYLRARDDMLIPTRISLQLQRLQPSMAIAEIDGPHFLLQTQAVATATAITRFISEALASP
jgi:pimeloyl-ACP methyl ester carboxylesterase